MRAHMFLLAFSAGVVALRPTTAIAQVQVMGGWGGELRIEGPFQTPGQPGVFVTGTGEVTLAATRATLRFSVQSTGPTGAEASAQVTQRLAAIADTLRRRGIAADSVQSGGLYIGPSGEMPMSIRRPNEFQARTELRVTIRKLTDVASVVDAALSAGASELSGVQYAADKMDEARREALRDGFVKARLSAEALASAAGRRLGELMHISTTFGPSDYMDFSAGREEYFMGSGRPVRFAPRDVVVRATVTAQWRLEPGR